MTKFVDSVRFARFKRGQLVKSVMQTLVYRVMHRHHDGTTTIQVTTPGYTDLIYRVRTDLLFTV